MSERRGEQDALPPGAWRHTCMAPGDETTCPGCRERAGAGWVRKPWPENQMPSADEWIDWFLTAPRDQQRAEVAMSLRDTERAIQCLSLHPQPRVISPASTEVRDV